MQQYDRTTIWTHYDFDGQHENFVKNNVRKTWEYSKVQIHLKDQSILSYQKTAQELIGIPDNW